MSKKTDKAEKRPKEKVLFKGGLFRSDAAVPAEIPITGATAMFRLRVTGAGEQRGVMVIRVRRPAGITRVYLRGVARYEVISPMCSCCGSTEVRGTFIPNRLPGMKSA